jgi:hypothetical protein
MTSFVPKTVLKALDNLEASLEKIDANKEALSNDPLSLAVTISGLFVLLKKSKGEDVEEATKEFEKCVKAMERFVESSKPKAAATTTADKSKSKKRDPIVSTTTSSSNKKSKSSKS